MPKKKILLVIPARGGSKRLKGKNFYLQLGGLRLINYSINIALKCTFNLDIVVTSDDKKILMFAKKNNLKTHLRPKKLAGDKAQLCNVIHDIYDYYKNLGIKYDAVISLQPTSPFLLTKSLNKIINLWIKTNCDSVTTISQITQSHPYISRKILKNNKIIPFFNLPKSANNSSQRRPVAYYLTGGIYLRSAALIENIYPKGHWLGKNSRAIIVNHIESIDINTKMDFQYAKFLLTKGFVKKSR